MATLQSPAGSTPAISPLILERWACPRCQDRRLQDRGESIHCPGCDAAFRNERGIPLFLEAPAMAERRAHIRYSVFE